MRYRMLVIFAFFMTVLAFAAFPQQRPRRVLLLYDMEGITGATNVKCTDFINKTEYTEARKSLTADVNAAIAGLKSGGATEIVVVDGHGSGNAAEPDVLEDQLLAPAKMISKDRDFDIYMDSYDHSYDAIAAVAMHAGAGNGVGFLSHTYTLEDIQYKVNGAPFNESMILAMGAGRFKIPLIMVSGDDQLERELRRNLPWINYAVVKHAVNRAVAESYPRDEASSRIESAGREAMQALDRAELPNFPGPYRFALTFQNESQARNAALLPGAEILAEAATVQIRANDFEEGYRQSLRLISLAGIVGQSQAYQAVLRNQANAAALYLAVNEWLEARWLNQLPAGAAAPGTPPRRFWGAR